MILVMRTNTLGTRSARATLVAAIVAIALALPLVPIRAATIDLRVIPTRSVTTLLFHQITRDPIRSAHGEDNVKEPWLTPERFDTLLSSLEARGYTVVSLDAALASLGTDRVRPMLPPKPLLLTFDDGYASALTIATPILRKHHAQAMMFFEGKLTGTKAGRVTIADLRAMRASGVWQLESHGWIGHGTVPVAADAPRSPYWYANLMWLANEHRLETLGEYERRIANDLHHFRTTFEPLLGTRLDVFAYPSGEFGQNFGLAGGGNPLTRLEAGHSNSHDLAPIFARVLAREGMRAAFAVDVPGMVHAASAQDGPYAFPRIGVGATFDPAILDTIATDGFELPEITSDDTFADCTAIATVGDDFITASVRRPEFFRLVASGRLRATFTVPELLEDRRGQPTLVSAIVAHDSDVTILQQAGWWPGATPYVTRVHVATGEHATVVRRDALPANLNWSVGAIERDGKLIAMTDEGRFYDIADARGAPLFSIAVASGDRHDRFTGPAIVRGRTFVYDRIAASLEEIDARGNVLATTPLEGDIRALGSLADDELLVVDGTAKRRIVRRFRLSDG